MFYEHLKGHLEALLFAAGDPLSAAKLAQILAIDEENVRVLVEQLQAEMQDDSRGLMIVEIAGGFQLCTKPELADVVSKLAKAQDNKLSAAALETLAIIAFKQPVTRQEIEAIRGVKADKVISTLQERQFIREAGRKDTIGRPILYCTTAEFLTCFGLRGLDELPDFKDVLPPEQS